MQYLNFEITNFKGIENVKLDLTNPEGRVFTLVGLNESGKTTILEAIASLWDVHRKPQDLIPKNSESNFTDSVVIKTEIGFSLSDKEEIIKYLKTDCGIRETAFIPDKLSFTRNYEFVASVFKTSRLYHSFSFKGKKKGASKVKLFDSKSEESRKCIKYVIEKFKPQIVYYENFLFDIPSKIQIFPVPEEKDFIKWSFYKVILDILDSIGEGDIETLIVNRMRNDSASDQRALRATTRKMGAKITELVLATWGEIMKSDGKRIVLHEERGENEEEFYLVLEMEVGTEGYPISQRSLGFKWFFSFLLFTELRKNRKDDPGETLFLLDEPASNLHSTAQKKLLSTFDKLVENNCKLMYTTHSHHLINPKYLESAYIVRNTALDYTDDMEYDVKTTNVEAVPYKRFVSQHPTARDYFQPILDTLEYQPGRLENIPFIVISEGKNDFYVFHYMNDVILNEKYAINIYPGNGARQIDHIIGLYMGWNRDFSILLDADHGGEAAKKKYIEDFGKQLQNQVFTYENIDISWKGKRVEDLFTIEEQMMIVNMMNPNARKFSKSLFHLQIQTLLAEKTKIELSTSTIEKFELIFRFFNFEVK